MTDAPLSLPKRPTPDALPLGSGRKAVVVDLPGIEGTSCGLALAERGFRPLPLYNATQGEGQEVIDLVPFLVALRLAAIGLLEPNIPDDAPPAFLIDSNRTSGKPQPGMFDNRWTVFPQDFPSGRALAAGGVGGRAPMPSSTSGAAPGAVHSAEGAETRAGPVTSQAACGIRWPSRPQRGARCLSPRASRR